MVHTQATIPPCPYTNQPFADCAIKTITGASIPKINRYCMGDYVLCPVYKAEHNKRPTSEIFFSAGLKHPGVN